MYVQYGKGRHPAALSYGDTIAYATAKVAHEPLIAVGNDFRQTTGIQRCRRVLADVLKG